MTIPFDVEGPVRVEIFVVTHDGAGILLTGPDGPRAWLAESHPPEHPLDTVRRLAETTIPDVLLVHSTSWRYDDGAVVLSFIVVIEPAAAMPALAVWRADLARSSATAAPDTIGQHQVMEHGLRHLAWLAAEDDVVRATLDHAWHTALEAYVPEPFQQL